MSRRWNGKALVDEIATRLWDTSDANKARIIGWLNEIQDDLTSEVALDHFKFRTKKLMPTQQEIISLQVEKPSVSGVVASGGSLTDGSTYKAYVAFAVYNDDGVYIEGEPQASSELSPTGANLQIDLTLGTYGGDTSYKPDDIRRNVYLAVKASGETSFTEPFYIGQLADNTTTTYSITAESSSTVTPPSYGEIDQISGDSPFFLSSGRVLTRENMQKIRVFNPQYSTSQTPYLFDYLGQEKINIYPALSSGATTAQRTLNFHVYRRPHEVFYDVDRAIDMPITAKKALIEGVVWKGYEFRDRDRVQEKLNNYMKYREEFINKSRRQRNRPGTVRDVTGDTWGYSV